MTYRERLNHWAVVRLLPNFQRVIVDRFRSRSDAEGHAQAMQRLVPDGEFIVVFDSVGLMQEKAIDRQNNGLNLAETGHFVVEAVVLLRSTTLCYGQLLRSILRLVTN